MTIMIARSFRYYVEGALAVFYGALVIEFIKRYGLMMLGAVGGAVLVGILIYLIVKRVRGTASLDESERDAESVSETPGEV